MNVMYIGPDIRGVVYRNEIFSYDAADIKEKAREISPYTQYLFVSMDEIVQKKRRLETPGSLESIAFRKVKQQEENK